MLFDFNIFEALLHSPQLTVSSILLLFVAVGIWTRLKSKPPRPPSPPGALPILGHIFQVSKDLWIPFTAWKEKYGPILYLNMIGQPLIVLNSLKVANDLLDRRSAIYSDRPRDIVGNEMLSGSHLMVLSSYGDRWRRIRRAAHDLLSNSVVSKFHHIQCAEAVLLVSEMLAAPDQWREHFDRMTSSSMLTMIYGHPPMKSHDDIAIKQIMEYVTDMTEATAPGKHLTQLVPALEYLPVWMAPWKRKALEGHERYTSLFAKLLREGKSRTTRDGTQTLAGSLGTKIDNGSVSEKEAAWIGAALVTAGTETVLTALGWILQTAIVYPSVQRAAHAEIDRVVGRDRMPNFEDLPKLHYVRALVQEVMRLFPATPFAIPHSLKEDDWYDGYFLQKGSTVIANVWAINRDPETYGPDAEVFNPSRYLDKDGRFNDADDNCTYGFGRRKCVGRAFSNNTLLITTACMLWGLNFEAPKASDGSEIIPDIESYVNVGLVRHPSPFKISARSRFPDVTAILAAAKEYHGLSD